MICFTIQPLHYSKLLTIHLTVNFYRLLFNFYFFVIDIRYSVIIFIFYLSITSHSSYNISFLFLVAFHYFLFGILHNPTRSEGIFEVLLLLLSPKLDNIDRVYLMIYPRAHRATPVFHQFHKVPEI